MHWFVKSFFTVAAVLWAVGIGSSAVRAQTVGGDAKSVEAAPAGDIAAKAAVAAPLVWVLRDEAVRRELRLSPAQTTPLDKLLSEVDYPLWYVRDARDAETQTKCARAFDHLEKNLATLLQPAQRARLDGVFLQAHGSPVLLTPKFADLLSLTAEQQTRIRDLLKQAERDKNAASGGSSAAQQKQIQEVLTDAQRRRLSQLMGAPFSAARIRARPCRAPALENVDEWINTEPLDWNKLEGKVVAVHFWAFGCINCVRNLPHYRSWDEKYAAKGLVVVGFHTPETQAERVVESVRAKVRENGMRYPVAVDGAGKNWNAWATRWWPSVYLVDKRGYVRYWWYGELNWEGAKGEEFMRKKIEELLAEKE